MTSRIALVTGGIGGIGTEICRSLAASGHRVIACDLPAPDDRLARFSASLDGADVHFEAADVSRMADCEALAQHVNQNYGPVSVLVNGAGITRDVSLRKMSSEQWHEVLRVNLDSVFNLCRLFADGMCERGFGRIVNISSIIGQTGAFGQSNYAAAKAGMHGFPWRLRANLPARASLSTASAPATSTRR